MAFAMAQGNAFLVNLPGLVSASPAILKLDRILSAPDTD
jgi:hypothetical protein